MSYDTFLKLTPGEIMDAVKEHRDEMAYNQTIFSHFTATICNSSGNYKRALTYRDVFDPFKIEVKKKLNQHTEEGKREIEEALKMF